ncbi:MAG: zinc-binding dehydrogenase, partial [Deltaproteobacteria bacterium]|nr:zinc-binding dehydrogenase [Deltaproteobacteria bacterium]
DYVILGMPDPGTFAEKIAQPLDKLHTIPAHLSFQEAAALPVAGVTAYRALVTRGEAKRGEHVLITGIGGGVATLALVFAKALGCDISVTSSSADKLARAKELGARWGVSYKEPGWEKALVKEAGRPPDVILDGAGGEGFSQLVAMAGPGARIVTYGATRALPSTIDLRRVFFRQLDIRGSTMGHSGEFVDMLKLIEREKVRPVIDRVFTLDQVRDAHARMDEGEQLGKIVLDLGA